MAPFLSSTCSLTSWADFCFCAGSRDSAPEGSGWTASGGWAACPALLTALPPSLCLFLLPPSPPSLYLYPVDLFTLLQGRSSCSRAPGLPICPLPDPELLSVVAKLMPYRLAVRPREGVGITVRLCLLSAGDHLLQPCHTRGAGLRGMPPDCGAGRCPLPGRGLGPGHHASAAGAQRSCL